MNARMMRIISDYEQIKQTFANHKNIVVEPLGEEPPEKYRVTYYINGIYLDEDGRIETLGKHVVTITLHAEYPRYKPLCTIETPIWHPNFRDGQICIGDIWGAGESLSDIIINIGDMIQYKSWNSFSPLSAEAAEWAIANKHLFPVGNVDLWTGEEAEEGQQQEFDIELLDQEPDDEKPEEDSSLAEGEDAADTVSEPENINISAPSVIEEGGHDENDFDITKDELVGITFVPAAERMQQSAYGLGTRGKRINLKTVLVKGVLWALIGAVLGFFLSEMIPVESTSKTIAGALGYEELARYFRYQEMAEAELEPLQKDFMTYCRKQRVDPDDEKVLDAWLERHTDYTANITQYRVYNERALNALEESLEKEFYYNSEALGTAVGRVICLGTSMWAGVIALCIGLFLGLGEGVYYGSKKHVVHDMLIGAGISLAIGLASGYIAQLIYGAMLTEYSSDVIKALVRGFGWSIMGLGIGLAVGLIKPERRRIIFCSIGGVVGAFFSGFIFNYIYDIMGRDVVSRAVGVVIMGLLIGIGVGLLEQFAKMAWFKVIRGEFEGKEYLIFAGTTSIGNNASNTIVLFKDKLVAPHHCDIVQEGRRYILVDGGSPMGTVVNGMRVTRHLLRQGDAVAIGNSVLIFNTK